MQYHGIFDTHAHYDDLKFEADRDAVLKASPEHGVSLIVDPACDLKSCAAVLDLANRYDFLYAAVGVHPEAAVEDGNGDYLSSVAEYAKAEKVVAIGEIGLDYYYDIPKDIQRRVFEEQLALANDLGLPVIVHDREAHGDTYELLKRYRPKGIVHCYSGSAEMAEELVKLGFYIGFTGSVTFQNAKKLLLAAKVVPDDRILLETDSPYLSPMPYRGLRNDSSRIPVIAERLAELRGTDAQTLIDQARENGCRVYGIKETTV
ncbi:MAG TPA: TatD family hydrolase [Oscillospiraceae bacterium]|nr:TatD family hydrolase [Oscillospiraceae bacterium]HRW57738.1 TatD family hydrolase [Oscillospiraceae bacterium]